MRQELAARRDSVTGVAWWEYVQQVTGGAPLGSIARRVELSEASISRWKSGTPRPENVAAFARAYRVPVVDAFVAAGWLTERDAEITPSALPQLGDLTDEDLLAEVAKRMKRPVDPVSPTSPTGASGVAYSDRLTRRAQAQRDAG